MSEYVKWFKEISKKDIGFAGGKGANLGEMYQSGFPIPNGFVVTAQSYWKFLVETELVEKITKTLENLNPENNDMLQSVAKKIREMIFLTNQILLFPNSFDDFPQKIVIGIAILCFLARIELKRWMLIQKREFFVGA